MTALQEIIESSPGTTRLGVQRFCAPHGESLLYSSRLETLGRDGILRVAAAAIGAGFGDRTSDNGLFIQLLDDEEQLQQNVSVAPSGFEWWTRALDLHATFTDCRECDYELWHSALMPGHPDY